MSEPIAFITGGTRGIGRATSLALVERGWRVLATYREDRAAALELEEVTRGKVSCAQLDVSDQDQVALVLGDLAASTRTPLAVVANAGRTTRATVDTLTDEIVDGQLGINARGTIASLRWAAKNVQDGGRVVLVSTGALLMPRPGGAAYNAGKAAAEAFLKVLATEVGERGVTANAVAPGPTETEGLVLPPEHRLRLSNLTPLGRLAKPADIAGVITFLCSAQAAFITGQTLHVNGGLV